jgi:hypothetical protein
MNKLKKQQLSYDSRLRKKQRYNQVLMKGEFLSSNEEAEVEVVIPQRTASTLQKRCSKFVLPLVTKLLVLLIGILCKVSKVSYMCNVPRW